MAFEKVALAGEIPSGRTKFVNVGNTPVVLANWKGRIYALSGICPHQHNPLEGACVWDYLIECPWHHFQFDVRSGENHYPKNVYPESIRRLQQQVRPLLRYPVSIRGGEIWVDVKGEAGAAGDTGQREGRE